MGNTWAAIKSKKDDTTTPPPSSSSAVAAAIQKVLPSSSSSPGSSNGILYGAIHGPCHDELCIVCEYSCCGTTAASRRRKSPRSQKADDDEDDNDDEAIMISCAAGKILKHLAEKRHREESFNSSPTKRRQTFSYNGLLYNCVEERNNGLTLLFVCSDSFPRRTVFEALDELQRSVEGACSKHNDDDDGTSSSAPSPLADKAPELEQELRRIAGYYSSNPDLPMKRLQ